MTTRASAASGTNDGVLRRSAAPAPIRDPTRSAVQTGDSTPVRIVPNKPVAPSSVRVCRVPVSLERTDVSVTTASTGATAPVPAPTSSPQHR